jgi:hypothetical protein
MNGIGIPRTLSSTESNVEFDLTAIGKTQRVGWVSGNEAGFLVIPDKNGKVKDGSQMFGEATRLPDGTKAKNGFSALAQYDLNQDNLIDSKDAIFKKLRVWFDKNTNGKVDAYELRTLESLKIDYLSLNFFDVDLKNRESNGNDLRYYSEGSKKMYDLYLGMSKQ